MGQQYKNKTISNNDNDDNDDNDGGSEVSDVPCEVSMLHGEMRQSDRDWVRCHAGHDMTRLCSKFLVGSGL